MSNKYYGTFTFKTSANPAQSFDKVQAMSAALGRKIELVYEPAQQVAIAVDGRSTKESFTAAVNKSLTSDHSRDVLVYNANVSYYPDPSVNALRINRDAQEIANKTGALVAYSYGGRYCFGFRPKTKKPSAHLRQQP